MKYIRTLGVGQGGPAAASLYCIHIDQVIERIIAAKCQFYVVSRAQTWASDDDQRFAIAALLRADDIALLARTKQMMQKILDILTKFCKEARCSFNLKDDKCIIMHNQFVKEDCHDFKLQGVTLGVKSCHKYLGIIAHPESSVAPTFDHNIKMAKRKFGNLKMLMYRTRYVSIKSMLGFYTTIIRPVLEHASEAFGCYAFRNASLL